jgi:hypothetical protein
VKCLAIEELLSGENVHNESNLISRSVGGCFGTCCEANVAKTHCGQA